MDHKEQYQSYLAQAMSALEHACAHFLQADPRRSGAQCL